jgi:hypothetical protein
MIGCPTWKAGNDKSLFFKELLLKTFDPSKGIEG